MPFGLKNAGTAFQQAMDDALKGEDNARCYINDVLIYTRTFEKHLEHLEQIFQAIGYVGSKLTLPNLRLAQMRSHTFVTCYHAKASAP